MSWSKVSLLSCYLLLFFSGFLYYPKWKQTGTEATLSWDASGYYMYLPAIFIYNDVKECRFADDVLNKYGPTPDFQQAFRHSSGNYVMKYSMGQAIQYMPAFFFSHIYATISDKYEADGFSRPYQLGISIHALIIACLGLYILFCVLKLYFNDKVTGLTLLAITFGSNYLDYSAINGAMTHNGLFTIYALLMWASHRYYSKPAIGKALFIGILVGIATLTRPTEIISCLIPLLWGMKLENWKERFDFIKSNWPHFLLAGGAVMIIGSLQLFYWKYVTGDWLVYSYEDQGFSWLKPHLYDGLLSYKSGWLTYSPLFILIIPGFIALRQMHRSLIAMSLTFTLLFIYIAFAWDIWWYGGSLGQRAMVQAYPVIALPLAASIAYSLKHVWSRILLVLFLGTCISYNLWLTHHAHRGGLFYAGQMTKAYFWKVLGKNEKKEEYLKLLDTNEEHPFDINNSEIIYSNSFNESILKSDCNYSTEFENYLCLNGSTQFSPEYRFNIKGSAGNWIHASALFHCIQKEWNSWQMTQFILKFYNGDQEVKSRLIRTDRLLHDGEIQRIGFETEIPDHTDTISVLFWNAGSNKPILIDELIVYLIK